MASTTVNFNLKTAGYVNYANQTLTFRLLTLGAEASTGDQSYVTLPGVVTATSAANGDGSVSLFRNGKSGIESVYEVILPNREKAKFIIPSGSATIELATLLVDHVPGGTNVQQSSVYAEAIKRANHTGTQLLSTISDATEGVQDIAGGMLTGNTETGITVTYQDADGTIDFVVASQTDQNFTNDDHTKLNGVEASADVTDTANVTSAGALMDSELTSIANVKALNQSVVSGASPTFVTTNMTDASDKRFMTNAQETKLDAIDADVTTLSLPASTTISTFAKTFLDDADAAAVKSTLGITDAAAISNFVPRSITFTNTSAYLSLADHALLDVDAGDFSLSFWARLDSSGTEPVLNKLSGTGYRLKFVSGSLILTMQDSGGSADFTLASSLNDNKWHVYVVTVDRNGNAIAYVDNVAQTGVSVSGTASTLANSGQFQIGSDGGSNAGDGIALGNYIALHKAVLTASQASQIFFSADAAFTVVAPTLMVDLRRSDKTFTDVSPIPLAVTTNGTIIFNEGRITSLDGATIGATTPAAVTGTNVLATTTLGYKAGGGGTVTQLTSKSTTVDLDKINGEITMHAAALADGAAVVFTFTNDTIAATDVIIANAAGNFGAYEVSASSIQAGTCKMIVRNTSGGALSEATKINFAVIKAVKT